MSLSAKNRYSAFGIHFAISLFIVINFAFLILFNWYPEPFLTADGGWSIFRMIFIVDLILGPGLTLIIYKPGKKGLKLDLTIIGVVQFTALIYGGTVLYLEKPAYVTFSVDRFVLVSKNDIDTSKFRFDELRQKPEKTPQLVFAKLPEDPKERMQLAQEVFQGNPDLEFRAEYYEPLAANKQSMFSRSLEIDLVRNISADYKEKINEFTKDHCNQDCGFFPLVGKKHDMILVINKNSLQVVGGIDIDPWQIERALKSAKRS